MIHQAVRLIADELRAFLTDELNTTATVLSLANVADLEQDNDFQMRERILMTVVNIEEESALKNIKSPMLPRADGSVAYEEPPVFINLYLLFTSTYDQSGDFYERALQRLALVIQFFQSKRVFSIHNSPGSSVAGNAAIHPEDRNFLRISLELYTMTFEQINHLWGSLGGHQVPFAMYKARLVRVRDRRTTGTGPVIEEVGTGEKVVPAASSN